jgi:hypothetical protein
VAALCPADRDGKGLSGVSDNGVPQDLMLDHAFPIKNCMGMHGVPLDSDGVPPFLVKSIQTHWVCFGRYGVA